MKKLILPVLLLFSIYASLSFIEKPNNSPDGINLGEAYAPDLFPKLQSVDAILSYADATIGSENRTSLEYAEFLALTLRKRFYHGYSYYTPKDNWMAWLSGKLIWSELNAIVLPDDILKHPNAACSQQAIVLSACFEKIGIPYREVDLVGHFVLEGKIDSNWYYFDTNLEPQFVNKRKSLQELISGNELMASYANKLQEDDFRTVFSSITYKPENAPIALKAMIFHRVTGFLSLVLLLLIPASGYVVYTRWKQSKA